MKSAVYINKISLFTYGDKTYEQILETIIKLTNLSKNEFYLTKNGKLYTKSSNFNTLNGNIQVNIRVSGGKGGFGSMLRAIGAQIEKTTNKEACRDLSGRRLRDINEEKKLKVWLEKQKERDEEAKERKKRKLERLTAIPKHEFKDTEYENARSELVEKISEAVEEGFKKTQSCSGVKRKIESNSVMKRAGLWIGDDISSGSDTDSDSSSDFEEFKKRKISLSENKNDEVESSESSLSNNFSKNELSNNTSDIVIDEKVSNCLRKET